MTEHTPRPWTIEAQSEQDQVPYAITAEVNYGQIVIAEVVQPMLEHDETIMANARLIVAAPEMYDAIEGTLADIDGSGQYDIELDRRTILSLRDAIAKAIGPVMIFECAKCDYQTVDLLYLIIHSSIVHHSKIMPAISRRQS